MKQKFGKIIKKKTDEERRKDYAVENTAKLVRNFHTSKHRNKLSISSSYTKKGPSEISISEVTAAATSNQRNLCSSLRNHSVM